MKYHLIEYVKCQILVILCSLGIPFTMGVGVWAVALINGESIWFWLGVMKMAFIVFAVLQASLHVVFAAACIVIPTWKFLDKKK